jgi:hypothetical protein
MSHVTVELHEKYPHEHIPDSEHDLVHEEMRAVGFLQIASQNGADHHLPRACYFSEVGTKGDIDRAWLNIRTRLSRDVSMEVTIGASYGYGLKRTVEFVPFMNLTPHAFPTPSSSLMSAGLPAVSPVPGFSALVALGSSEKTNYGGLVGLMAKPK